LIIVFVNEFPHYTQYNDAALLVPAFLL